jgi:hypothetical protein
MKAIALKTPLRSGFAPRLRMRTERLRAPQASRTLAAPPFAREIEQQARVTRAEYLRRLLRGE